MKIYKKVLLVSLLFSWSYAQTQPQPHNEPLIWEKPPKANILMMLDDSASMDIDDMPGGTSRALVLQEVILGLVGQYRDLGNIGLSGLGYNSPTSKSFWTEGARRPLKMAISDISTSSSPQDLSEINFTRARHFAGTLPSDGNTPLAFALYEATKYFRGLKMFSGLNKADKIFDESHHPVQYRCQQNHIIMLSDSGGSNQEALYGLVSGDTNSGTVQLDPNSKIDSIAKKMWEDIDLRDYPPTTPELASLASKDLAGKLWKNANDPGSKKLPIYFHGIFFGATAQGVAYDAMKNAASYSKGIISEAKDTESLSAGFHKIFQTISKPKSSGYIVRNQNINNKETLQYRTAYDSSDWTGKLIAEQYNSSRNTFEAAWDTDEKMFLPTTVVSQFYTFDGNTQVVLTTNNLNKIPGVTPITDDQVAWLKGEKRDKLRPRSRIIADSINSKLYHIGKYEGFMNTDFLSEGEKTTYDKFYEAKQQSAKDTVIFGTNDGLINFFTAGKSGGDRKYAYFPSFFAAHMDEITKQNYVHNYKVDGPMSFFDLRTNQEIKTVGLTGMGAGYQAIAAFEIFSTTANGSAPSNDLKLLYEITSKTGNFDNLGYTYSQFGFSMDYNGGYKPTAIFGNGYGSKNNISSLFMINADDGKYQDEIILSSNQGNMINGASTPAVIVAKDLSSGFHKLERIYVGDYAGRLYRIRFDANGNKTVTLLFKDPNSNPITTKPVVTYKNDAYWISFGTGSMIDVNLDKGANSKKMHTFYGIKDDDSITGQSNPIQLSNLLKQELTSTANDSNNNIHLSSNVMTPAHKGWYIPLTVFGNNSGERIVDDPVIFLNKYVHFATMGINEGDPNDPCLGDAMFGALVFATIETGGAADGVFMDTNQDNKIDRDDQAGVMGRKYNDYATGVLSGVGFTKGGSAEGGFKPGLGEYSNTSFNAQAARKDGENKEDILIKNKKTAPIGRIYLQRKL